MHSIWQRVQRAWQITSRKRMREHEEVGLPECSLSPNPPPPVSRRRVDGATANPDLASTPASSASRAPASAHTFSSLIRSDGGRAMKRTTSPWEAPLYPVEHGEGARRALFVNEERHPTAVSASHVEKPRQDTLLLETEPDAEAEPRSIPPKAAGMGAGS